MVFLLINLSYKFGLKQVIYFNVIHDEPQFFM
jgi:hypothetical protein